MTTAERTPQSRLRPLLDRSLATPRPLVMGVVNVTPDSFSDGGRFLAPADAIAHAMRLVEEGADLLDFGAESTRPGGGVYGEGAAEIGAAMETSRLLPVLEAVRKRTELPLSVDTRNAVTARAALDAGADLINDITALTDPALAAIVAEQGCPVVLMHSRGELRTMQRGIHFDDLLDEVRSELAAALQRATAAGVDRRQVILDPGIGFGKTCAQNLALMRGLPALAELGQPLLVGASRKSFIGELSGAAVDDRLPGSLAAVAWCAANGADVVRVHDVAATRQFLAVWSAIDTAPEGSPR